MEEGPSPQALPLSGAFGLLVPVPAVPVLRLCSNAVKSEVGSRNPQCSSLFGVYCLQSTYHGFIVLSEGYCNFYSCFTEKENMTQKIKYLAQSHKNSKRQSCPHPWRLLSLSVIGASTSDRNFVSGQLWAANQSHQRDPVSSCRWL